MAALTTRAAAVALAAGVGMSGGALFAGPAFAGTPAPNCTPSSSPLVICPTPTVSGPTPNDPPIGGTFTLTVTNVEPFSTVTVKDPAFPGGQVKTTGKADASGTITFTITVPDASKTGKTQAIVSGTDVTGKAFAQNRPYTIVKASDPTTVARLKVEGLTQNIAPGAGGSSGGGGTSTGGGLAFTGAEIGGMSVVGLGLLGTGAFLLVGTRRRRSATRPAAA